jgi:hypothetical protein
VLDPIFVLAIFTASSIEPPVVLILTEALPNAIAAG